MMIFSRFFLLLSAKLKIVCLFDFFLLFSW